MKRLFIVANWKSNLSSSEAKDWLERFTIYDLRFTNKEIIICPSFTVLSNLKSYILNHKSPLKLCAQDISPFSEGAYTGEVNGKQIREFADYVLIGHSERRNYFKEDDYMLEKKVKMAINCGLTPIFCVQDQSSHIPQGVSIVAYEPVFAIGTGTADTPENANSVAEEIRRNDDVQYVLYGGSVTPKNIRSFTSQPHISGVLVGGASLDAKEFFEIVKNA